MIEEISVSMKLNDTNHMARKRQAGVPIIKQGSVPIAGSALHQSQEQLRMNNSKPNKVAVNSVSHHQYHHDHQQEDDRSNDTSPTTSSKKIRLNKLMGKLNKSLEDFFLKDGPEESSYIDDISMMKHYNR